jgi:GNAT acetyltransferase-like protein
MFLKILLCHPDHRRRGAGTALVKWGAAVARLVAGGVDTALFASPMGALLYRRLGFREVGRFEVAVEGDGGERLDIPAMVLAAPATPALTPSRRGSSCAGEATVPGGLRKCVTNSVVVGKV